MARLALASLLVPALAAWGCGGGTSATAAKDGGTGHDAASGLDGAAAPDGSTDAGSEGGASTPADAAPTVDAAVYANPALWLCGAPGVSHDYCLDSQSVTTIAPDLSQTVAPITPAASPSLDCFYVYPSVDITSPPGNETNFSNLPDILDPVHEQAAPFSQVCKVYAPLYHQATFQSYYSADADEYLEIAYADVAAAFQEYLAEYNHGRDFVLLGHSQGSHMLRRLIQRVIEPSPALEKQLVVGVLAGTLGDLTVPDGKVVGGSFQVTPLCTSGTERQCVVTFNTFAEGYEPTSTYGMDFAVPPGMDIGCTNPAALGGGLATLADTLFYTTFNNQSLDPPQSTGVSTAFAAMPKFYTGQCVKSAAGFSFFEINPAPGTGDQRSNPIPFSSLDYTPAVLGLHLLDYAFPMGDLLAGVKARTGQ